MTAKVFTLMEHTFSWGEDIAKCNNYRAVKGNKGRGKKIEQGNLSPPTALLPVLLSLAAESPLVSGQNPNSPGWRSRLSMP